MQVHRLRAQVDRFGEKPQQQLPEAVALAVGNFDGVHLGHQRLVDALLRAAKAKGLGSAVMLFEPQPLEFFKGAAAPQRLMSWREKARLLAALGVEHLCLVRFDSVLSRQSPQAFVESFLLGQCQARHLVIGDDFRFGYKRAGDLKVLRDYAAPGGLEIEQAPTCTEAGVRVSSTRIRAALGEGDFKLAQVLLGRPFEMSGKVVYGDGLGRQFGFPTANLRTGQSQLPLQGVFAVTVTESKSPLNQPVLPAEALPAVANLGLRPTLQGKGWRCEVHILHDQVGSLYGKRLHIRFIKKLRDEQAFKTIEALKAAIHQDTVAAHAVFDE